MLDFIIVNLTLVEYYLEPRTLIIMKILEAL